MRNFFKLSGVYTEVDQATFVLLLNSRPKLCRDLLYRPDRLVNPYLPGRYKVKRVHFVNVSLSRTVVTGFEFTECTFDRSLFIGTIFSDCRFTSCRFVDSNPWRTEFMDCYVDPKSFTNCIYLRRHSNIGVSLFQDLLRNSRQQGQPKFADDAQYLFKKWERHLLWQELIANDHAIARNKMAIKLMLLLLFDLTAGSGMRIGRLLLSSFAVLVLFTFINYCFSGPMGLMNGKVSPTSVADAFYFSTIVTTTLGFGDIVPTTPTGRVVVSFEAISGFMLFALLTSTLYRKLTS